MQNEKMANYERIKNMSIKDMAEEQYKNGKLIPCDEKIKEKFFSKQALSNTKKGER